jgi:hypothetical protein
MSETTEEDGLENVLTKHGIDPGFDPNWNMRDIEALCTDIRQYFAGKLPEKYDNWKDVPNHVFSLELPTYSKKSLYRRAHNQALDDCRRAILGGEA